MATETIEAKAHRLLAEGRLIIEKVLPNSGLIVASCRGFSNGEVYRLGHDPAAKNGKGEWRCTCSASAQFHRRCSHLVALQLVTKKPRTASQYPK